MSTLFLKKIKKFSRPPERAGDRGASVLVAEVFPVADHDVGEELSGGGGGVGTVSYTHLDVYKRQFLWCKKPMWTRME